jgi:hypothetical protein
MAARRDRPLGGGESIAWGAMTPLGKRRAARRLVIALACVAALAPAGVAQAQGSGVGLGSAHKLSSAPPSSHTTTTTTSAATTTAHTATAHKSSSTAHAQQLPFTGADVPALVLIGGTLLLAGLALRVRTRDAGSR